MKDSTWDKIFCAVGLLVLVVGLLVDSQWAAWGLMVTVLFGWKAKHSQIREELAEIKERLPK